jgi:hypothetical protein
MPYLCQSFSEQVAVSPSNLGIDLQLFSSSCQRLRACYDHGEKTYRKSASACLDDFYTDMQLRCDTLCQDSELLGTKCSQLSASDLQTTLAENLLTPLYNNCQVVAGRAFQERQASLATDLLPLAQQHCEDYDGVGVSCTTPTCSLTASTTAVPLNQPNDIDFELHVEGSVYTIDFDGNHLYDQQDLAFPIDSVFTVVEEDRIFAATKSYSATIQGPADQPAVCSVMIDVIEEPDPCSITITPSQINSGGSANLFMTVLPGFDLAYMDLRTLNVFTQIGLSAPDELGNRYFSSLARPNQSRWFSANVVNSATSEQFTCSAFLEVQ